MRSRIHLAIVVPVVAFAAAVGAAAGLWIGATRFSDEEASQPAAAGEPIDRVLLCDLAQRTVQAGYDVPGFIVAGSAGCRRTSAARCSAPLLM